jgi:hypothetical protein
MLSVSVELGNNRRVLVLAGAVPGSPERIDLALVAGAAMIALELTPKDAERIRRALLDAICVVVDESLPKPKQTEAEAFRQFGTALGKTGHFNPDHGGSTSKPEGTKP